VLESAVIGLDHPDFGEAVAAVVVRAATHPDLASAAIKDHLKGELASFKIPRQVFFVDELPRNTMGKVQKSLLRKTYGSLPADA